VEKRRADPFSQDRNTGTIQKIRSPFFVAGPQKVRTEIKTQAPLVVSGKRKPIGL